MTSERTEMLSHPTWRLSDTRSLTLDRPRVMAILNVTPDSFSDGGLLASPDDAVRAAETAIEAGADLLDLGAESTRPGASRVAAAEQIRRAVPALAAIRRALGDKVAITIDTTLEPVARAALDSGADAINDVAAGLDDLAMLDLAAARRCGIVLMHRLRPPSSDQFSTSYKHPPSYAESGGVVAGIRAFLQDRAAAAIAAGVPRDGIVLDPGLGFGKSVEDNLALIADTRELASLGFPILSGLSRKSFTARAAGLPDGTPPAQRIEASVRLSVEHFLAGASIFRVHDVAEHVLALRLAREQRC